MMQQVTVTLAGLARIGEALHQPGDTVVVSPAIARQLADAGAISETETRAVDLDLIEQLTHAEGRAAQAEAATAEARDIVATMQARMIQLERDLAHMDTAVKELAAELAASRAQITQLQAASAGGTPNTPPSETAVKKKAATREG